MLVVLLNKLIKDMAYKNHSRGQNTATKFISQYCAELEGQQ
jgi:hypothetical protein